MILVDSSAWIEFLRGSGSVAHRRVADSVQGNVASTDPVLMEILAGARNEAHHVELQSLLGRTRMIRCIPADYLSAAAIYRSCRSGGETVRRLVDCLIAAVAIREGIPVVHADRDFDVIARHTSLTIAD